MKPFAYRVPLSTFHHMAALPMLIAALLVLSGCSTVRNITGQKDGMRKKIAITVFDNKTAIDPDNFHQFFQANLTNRIKKACSDTWIVLPGDKDYPDFLKQLPKLASGRTDNFALATSGRKLGFNAIVIGSLLDFKMDRDTHGFWWFKGTHPVAELAIGAEVYDTETGAKIFDDRFYHKAKIKELEVGFSEPEGGAVSPDVTKALQRIADSIGNAVCDRINTQPWKGYIISVAEDKIIISSGSNIGLAPGKILEVYNSGKATTGFEGQQFYLPGLKIGEITITAVFPHRSEAKAIAGKKDIQSGCSVKPK